MIRQAAILLLLTLAAAAGTHFFHPKRPVWYLSQEPLRDDEITLALVNEKWAGNVLWIDARIESRFALGHVPGAILLNDQNFHDKLADHLEALQKASVEQKAVVVYCDAEACQASRKIREELVQTLGLENVFILKGGWRGWQSEAGQR